MPNELYAARQMLWAWGDSLQRIRRLEAEKRDFVRFARDARDTLRAQSLDGLPKSTRPRDLSDTVANIMTTAEKYDAAIQKIDQQIADVLRIREIIDEFLRGCTSLEINIVEYRYLDKYRWADVERLVRLTNTRCRQIETGVLTKLARNLQIEKDVN